MELGHHASRTGLGRKRREECRWAAAGTEGDRSKKVKNFRAQQTKRGKPENIPGGSSKVSQGERRIPRIEEKQLK